MNLQGLLGFRFLLQYYELGLIFARAPSSYQKLRDTGFAYIVFQIDSIQEDPEHPILLAFKDQPPDYVVVIQGIPLVYIYRITRLRRNKWLGPYLSEVSNSAAPPTA